MSLNAGYLTIIPRTQSEYCRDYSTIFTQPEENNCFTIIAQVIIRATAFSFILFVSPSETSRNRTVAILENLCFSIMITSRGAIIARYDAILDQSDRAHLYNHLSNYTKTCYNFGYFFLSHLVITSQPADQNRRSLHPAPHHQYRKRLVKA